MIFYEGEAYFKNEGEVEVMNPHIEGLIFYNNDDSLHPSTTRYMGSPSLSSPLRVPSSSPTIRTHVYSQAIYPFSPPRKTRSLKEIYETSRYVDHNFAFFILHILNLSVLMKLVLMSYGCKPWKMRLHKYRKMTHGC